jgi:hypothetical protein
MTIERMPTPEEFKDFTPIGIGRKIPAKEKFIQKMTEFSEKIKRQGKPFCDKAALDEWARKQRDEIESQTRQYGFITREPDPEIDFSKYCDLNNFTMEPNAEDPTLNFTGEEYDPTFSKKHNKEAKLKYRIYRFKGYESYKYRVMEPTYGAWDKDIQKMSEVSDAKQKKA